MNHLSETTKTARTRQYLHEKAMLVFCRNISQASLDTADFEKPVSYLCEIIYLVDSTND